MKHSLWAKFYSFALCIVLCLAWLPGKAEECFVVNIDHLDLNSLNDDAYVTSQLSAQSSSIRIQKYISDSNELASRIRLTILQVNTDTIIFDKNYGYQGKTFDSGDIYLPYVDNYTIPYLITLYVDDWVYAVPFMHQVPRLSFNGACTYGVRMRDYNPELTTNWLMGTMVDLAVLREQQYMSIPICASNYYFIGEATLTLVGEKLTVATHFEPSANVELHYCAVYAVARMADLTTADPQQMTERIYQIGETIDVTGLNSLLLYLPMSLSYDPIGLPVFEYNLWGDMYLQRQLALWNENLGQSFPETYYPEIPTPEPIPEAPVQELPNDPPKNPSPNIPESDPPVIIEPPEAPIPDEILPEAPEIIPAPMPAVPDGENAQPISPGFWGRIESAKCTG